MNLQHVATNVRALHDAGATDAQIDAYLADNGTTYDELVSNYTGEGDRSVGEVVTDTGAAITKGIGNLVATPGNLYGLSTGNMGNPVSQFGEGIAALGESWKSPELQGMQLASSRRVQAAAQDGLMAEFGAGAYELISNPSLMANFIFEQVPQLAGTYGAGALARGGAKAFLAVSTEKALARAGITGAAAAGISMHGAQTGAEAYDQVYNTAVSKGMRPEEAADAALHQARIVAAQAAATAAATFAVSSFGPGANIERAMFGISADKITSLPKAFAATGLKESIGEAIEEGGGQFQTGSAIQTVDPTYDPMTGVMGIAGHALAGSAAMGGGIGALSTGLNNQRLRGITRQENQTWKQLERDQADAAAQDAAARAQEEAMYTQQQADTQRTAEEDYMWQRAAQDRTTAASQAEELAARAQPHQQEFANEAELLRTPEGIQTLIDNVDDYLYGATAKEKAEFVKLAKREQKAMVTAAKKAEDAAAYQADVDTAKASESAFTYGQPDLFGLQYPVAQAARQQSAAARGQEVSPDQMSFDFQQSYQPDMFGAQRQTEFTPVQEPEITPRVVDPNQIKLPLRRAPIKKAAPVTPPRAVATEAAQMDMFSPNAVETPQASTVLIPRGVPPKVDPNQITMDMTPSNAKLDKAPAKVRAEFADVFNKAYAINPQAAVDIFETHTNANKPASVLVKALRGYVDEQAKPVFLRQQAGGKEPLSPTTKGIDLLDIRQEYLPASLRQQAPVAKPVKKAKAKKSEPVDTVTELGDFVPTEEAVGFVPEEIMPAPVEAAPVKKAKAKKSEPVAAAPVTPPVEPAPATVQEVTSPAPEPIDTAALDEQLKDVRVKLKEIRETNKGNRAVADEILEINRVLKDAGDDQMMLADAVKMANDFISERAEQLTTGEKQTLSVTEQNNLAILESVADLIPEQTTAALTVDTLRAAISKKFKASIDAMIKRADEGKRNGLVITQTVQEAADRLAKMYPSLTPELAKKYVAGILGRASAEGSNLQGFYHPGTGTVFLIADNLDGTIAEGVLYHETVHRTATPKEEKQALDLVNSRESLHGAMRKFVDKVYKRMKDAGVEGDAREAIAYVVEEAMKSGRQNGFSAADNKFIDWLHRRSGFGKRIADIVRDFVARVRAWYGVDNLTVDDMIAVAQRGLRQAVKEGEGIAAKEAPIQASVASTNPAAEKEIDDALAILGRDAVPVKPTTPIQRATEAMRDGTITREQAIDEGKLFAQQSVAAAVYWADKMQTKITSDDARLVNVLRRRAVEAGLQGAEFVGTMLKLSKSQVLHAAAVAHEFVLKGGIVYDPETYKWRTVENERNIKRMMSQAQAAAETHGVTFEKFGQAAQMAFEARRMTAVRDTLLEHEREAEALRQLAKAEKNGLAAHKLRQQAKDAEKSAQAVIIHLTDEQLDAANKLFNTFPELEEVWSTWDAVRKNAVKLMTDTSLLTDTKAKEWMDSIGYVPFYRTEEDGAEMADITTGTGLEARRDKGFKGSFKPVDDVFDNMVQWTMYAVQKSVRNHKALELVDATQKLMPAGFVTETKAPSTPKDKASTVHVMRKGAMTYYKFEDPLFASAFQGLGGIQLPVMTFMSKMSNLLRRSIVLNPLFSASQLTQDSVSAMYTSGLSPRYAIKILPRTMKEFYKTLRGTSETHEELKKSHAVGIRDFSSSIAISDAEVLAGLHEGKATMLAKAIRTLEAISMASDNAVRQAVYQLAIEQGLSRAEALEKAFEIINFRRRGSSATLAAVSRVIPFFSAYLQAQNVALKVLSGTGISPQVRAEALKTLAHNTAMVMTMALLYTMLMSDDDDYKEREGVVRDRQLIMPGGLSIPLRTDLFLLPKMLTEHMYLHLTDNTTVDGAKTRKSISHALAQAMLSPTVVPQAIKPLAEVALNKNLYTGREILPARMKEMDAERQFSNSTSEFSKLLGNFGVSPIVADHLIRGTLGSVGGLVTWTSNRILSGGEGPRPDESFNDVVASFPGMSVFVAKDDMNAVKSDYYDLVKEVEGTVNTFNDIKKRNPELAAEYAKGEGTLDKLRLNKALIRINDQLGKLRQRISQVTAGSQMTGQDKRKEIDRLKVIERRLLENIKVQELRARAGM